MYAIAFDLDTTALQASYPNGSWQNAYAQISQILVQNGFTRQQGSVYFGGPNVTAVHCVLAVQVLDNTFSWFGASVRDIRMLRIEEMNDLSLALRPPARLVA